MLSAIILAGGKSTRMGTDKAFLRHEGRTFISTIATQMSTVSDDVVVMVGRKDSNEFTPLLDENVRVFNDDGDLSNPLGGILSGLGHVRHARAAIVGCDMPLLKAEVIDYLFEALGDHSAAVPVWEEGAVWTMEPLCAVYGVVDAKRAIAQTLNDARPTAKRMVLRMRDVLYVGVSRLRPIDPMLDSLVNVNTQEDYSALEKGGEPPNAVLTARTERWLVD